MATDTDPKLVMETPKGYFAIDGNIIPNDQRHSSPSERLAMALNVLDDALLRLITRRIWENEAKGGSIFWDANEKQVEFVHDDWEIIIRQRTKT